MFQYLVDEKNVVLDVKNNDVDDLYNTAMRRGYKEIAEYLASLKKFTSYVKNNDVDNSLCIADKNVSSETTELLVDKEVVPYVKNNYKYAPSSAKNVCTEKESGALKGIRGLTYGLISNNYKEVKMPNSGKLSKISYENNENESPNIMKPVAEQSTQVTSRGMISELCRENSNPASRSEKLHKVSSLRNPNIRSSLTQRRFSVSTHTTSNVRKNSHKLETKSNNLQQNLNEKTNEPMSVKAQLMEKELNHANQRVSQLEQEQNVTKQQLEELKSKNENKIQELRNKIQQLEVFESKNNDLKTKMQKSESKSKELESQINDLQKQLESKIKELEGKDKKSLIINVQGAKGKINYASVSFVLSGAFAVGASLTIPYLAICIPLAIAAFIFLATGCYCSYKANTALSNVEVDQVLKYPDCIVSQNSL